MTTTATDRLVPFAEAVQRYEPLIGLETHVELGTRTKMFCGCLTTFGAEPNSQVCPVCLGLPGSLPVVNRMAIEHTIRIGLALNCSIATWCRFARKNYFYPDMPKNFQISQYDEPLCTDGWLDVRLDAIDHGESESGGTGAEGGSKRTVRVGIERVHLEEDTGKSLHVGGATGRIHGAEYSLVDYNRAGIPLVEIVTKPIEGTGADAPVAARAYVTELRDLLRSLGVSDVRMEEGSLRCDVNTSLAPRGSGRWGTRTETKNVNSLRSVERAVRFEIERQAAVLDSAGRVIQETRHFHEETGTTTPGRSKEEAQDYRYFPEPDLVPVAPDKEWVEGIRASITDSLTHVSVGQRVEWNVEEAPTPSKVRKKLADKWGLSEADMEALNNAEAVELVAETIDAGASAADARKWWLGEMARRANEAGVGLSTLAITPAQVTRIAEQVRSLPAFTPAEVTRIAEQVRSLPAFTPAEAARIAEQVRSMARIAEQVRSLPAFTPAEAARIAEQVRSLPAFTPAEAARIAEQVRSLPAFTPAEAARIAEQVRSMAEHEDQIRSTLRITPTQVAQITKLVSDGTLNERLGRTVIGDVLVDKGTSKDVVADRGLAVVSDEGALTAAIDEAIAANPDVASKIRDGKIAAAGVLVGTVMKATQGKANAVRVRELILARLGS